MVWVEQGVGRILVEIVGIFLVALVVVRVMGNRTVGQFSPFDFVLMVGIGDIVGNVALDRDVNLIAGVEGLIGILLLQQVLARLSLKSTVLRKWFEGTPVAVVQDGKILRENLAKTQFNLDDMRQELHKKGLDFTHLKDIKVARIESCGEFSIIKVPDLDPLTKRDLDNFFEKLSGNPLSPAGAGWAKLEQLAADVQVLAEYVREQQLSRAPVQPTELQNTNGVH